MADCLRLPQYVAARKRVVHCVIWSPCSTLHAARGGRHPLPRSTSPPRLSPLALPVRNPFAHDDTPALALPDTRPNLKVDEAAGRVDLPPLSGLLPETPQRLRGGLIPLLCRLAVPLHGILLARCDPAPYLIHPANRTGAVPLFAYCSLVGIDVRIVPKRLERAGRTFILPLHALVESIAPSLCLLTEAVVLPTGLDAFDYPICHSQQIRVPLAHRHRIILLGQRLR